MMADRPVRRLLFVDEDAALAQRVGELVASARGGGWRVAHLSHLEDALVHVSVGDPDIVLVGPAPADCDQLGAVRRLSAAGPELPVVAVMRGRGDRGWREAAAAGAAECLDVDDLNAELWGRTLAYCRREVEVSRELARVNARLDWLTHMDGLTDLLNRRGLERAMMDELARCRRRGRELMLVLADLDGFTGVNACLGHGIGDLVLVNAARRLREAVREDDHVGRCGTDRFVVVLPDADRTDAETVAEKIRLGISRDAIQAGGHKLTMTASLAVIAVAPEALSFDEVLAGAHVGLQQAKSAGGNNVALQPETPDVGSVTARPAADDQVRELLRGDVLEAVAQPIVNLVDGRIVSHEMLIRGPRGPLHRPDDLFRFCQEQDILQALDLRCLRRCVTAARAGGLSRYHVNIMPATLLQTPATELVRVLRGANGSRGHCVLEISEQQLLSDPTVLVEPVRDLQAAGLQIAIDDVGFGNSCLEGLVMLQPQIMKVDKRMVAGLDRNGDLRRSLNRLLLVAEALGAEVVAEGIESAADHQVLLDLGVRFGQGFHFGTPAPLAPVEPPPPPRPDAGSAGAEA